MGIVIRKLGMAVGGASHDAGGAGVEGKFLTFETALGDGEGDLGWHLEHRISISSVLVEAKIFGDWKSRLQNRSRSVPEG
jgi:hypothetical protein